MATKQKRSFWLVWVIVSIAIIMVWFFVSEPIKPRLPDISQGRVEYLPHNQIPPELPASLPFEEGAPSIRNEIVTLAGDQEAQYVRAYYSQKTVEENYLIFRDYFLENSWQIFYEQNENDFAVLIGKQSENKKVLKVNISRSNITSDITVEISVTLVKI